MKKRILSLLLALCMVFLALPVFVMAAVADGGAEAPTITISFRLPDGTEVCSRTVTPGVADFDLPNDEELGAALTAYNAKEGVAGKYELAAADILGFYEVKRNGEIVDATAYKNTMMKEGKTFYAFTTKALFTPTNNWPLYTGKASFDGYRGGWTVGSYAGSGAAIVPYEAFDAANNILNAGNTWTGGGVYLEQGRMITTNDNSVSLAWRAIVPGTVKIDMLALQFDAKGDGAVQSDTVMAIAKNGVIVWPKKDAGKTLADTWATAGKDGDWFYASLPNSAEQVPSVGSVLDQYTAECTANGAPEGITVAAGDDIQLVFKRSQSPHISCNAAVVYTEVTGGVDAEAAGIVTRFAYAYRTFFSRSSDNFPLYTAESGSTVTFRGNWDLLYYKNNRWGDSTRVLMNKAVNFNSVGGDGFFNDGRALWGGSNAVRIDGGSEYWGEGATYSLIGSMECGGYRYTAEYDGLADISFSTYASMEGDGFTAIFLNGQMIWPNVGDYMKDASKWAPLSTTATTPENLPTNILLNKGDMVEFLLMAGEGSTQVRSVNLAPMTVTYKALYATPPSLQLATEEKDGSYNVTLTVDKADVVDAVTVEVANQGTEDWTELTADAARPDVFMKSYERKDYEPYTVIFRVTMKQGEVTLLPQTFSVDIPSRYPPLIHTGFGLKKNVPTTDADVTFQGNWDFMLYAAASEIGTSAGRLANKYYATGGSAVYSDNPAIGYGADPSLTAGFNYHTHHEWGGQTYGAYVRNGSAVSYRYTAQDSGLVNITLDKLGHVSSPWASDVSWGIFLNGEKIWPKDDTAIEGLTFADGWLRHTTAKEVKENLLTAEQLAAINAQLKNIYLHEGDKLEFACYAPGTASPWSNTGNVCYMSVDYVSRNVAELPAYKGVSATIGNKYGFTFLTEGENADIDKLELALTFGSGRTLTVDPIADMGGFRVDGILPAEMTEKITYKICAVSTNGTVTAHRVLAEGETTYAEMLSGYLAGDADVKTRDMVIATLQYGAAMQKRTMTNMDNLATAVLGEGDTLSFMLTDPVNAYAQAKDASKAYNFTGASLLLQDTVRVKLYIDLAEGMKMSNGELFLEYATTADFTGAKRSALTQRGNEGETWRSNAHLKAILDILPTACTGAMYFRVVTADGTVVSTTLTYSVDSYAARVPAEAEMTAAIRALGIATANYLAEEA